MIAPAARLATVLFVVALWPAVAAGQEEALEPGDTVIVTVEGHPDLSGRFVLNMFGDLTLPRAGVVRAEGLDPAELAARVQQAHARFIAGVRVSVKKPEVARAARADPVTPSPVEIADAADTAELVEPPEAIEPADSAEQAPDPAERAAPTEPAREPERAASTTGRTEKDEGERAEPAKRRESAILGVEMERETNDATVDTAGRRLTAATDFVLRAAGDSTAAVVGFVRRGGELRLLRSRGSWMFVRAGERSGWVRAHALAGEAVAETDDLAQSLSQDPPRAIDDSVHVPDEEGRRADRPAQDDVAMPEQDTPPAPAIPDKSSAPARWQAPHFSVGAFGGGMQGQSPWIAGIAMRLRAGRVRLEPSAAYASGETYNAMMGTAALTFLPIHNRRAGLYLGAGLGYYREESEATGALITRSVLSPAYVGGIELRGLGPFRLFLESQLMTATYEGDAMLRETEVSILRFVVGVSLSG